MTFAVLIWSVMERRKHFIPACGRTKVTDLNGGLLPAVLHQAARLQLPLKRLRCRPSQPFVSLNHSVQGWSSRSEQSSLLLSRSHSFLKATRTLVPLMV